jgi:hypothetical protein
MGELNQGNSAMSEAISNITKIGENDYGYWFGVGQLEGRWIGFAVGRLDDGNEMVFWFPEIAEGHLIGLADCNEAIKASSAIVQDPSHAYGGIQHWLIPEELRGNPDDYRCGYCCQVGCPGDCSDAVADFYDRKESLRP